MNQMLAEPNYYGRRRLRPCGPYRGAVDATSGPPAIPAATAATAAATTAASRGCCGQWYAGVSALVLGRSDAPARLDQLPRRARRDAVDELAVRHAVGLGGRGHLRPPLLLRLRPLRHRSDLLDHLRHDRLSVADLARRLRQHAARSSSTSTSTARTPRTGSMAPRSIASRGRTSSTTWKSTSSASNWPGPATRCWDIGWSVGIRYFRFQEDLDFGR